MGTPQFSVPTLERLAASEHRVLGVVTRPDAPRGRGLTLEPPAVKLAAQRLHLPYWQPESLRDEETTDLLASLEPDLIVVVAFRILPPDVLAIPKLGSLNLHASLLPRYRGPAPIQWALVNGDTTTGVTVFLLEPTVDTGKVIRQREVAIGPDETYGELAARLATLGAPEMLGAVEELAEGTAHPMPQDDSKASSAPKLTKQDGLIDWSLPSATIRNRVRAVTPSPGAYTFREGESLGVHRVDFVEHPCAGDPGEIVVSDRRRGVAVKTGDGALWLTTVLPAGKRPMDGAAWGRGARALVGQKLGALRVR